MCMGLPYFLQTDKKVQKIKKAHIGNAANTIKKKLDLSALVGLEAGWNVQADWYMQKWHMPPDIPDRGLQPL